jgi:large subunit ribosomal protein L25
MKTITIEGTLRTDFSKAAVRNLRSEEKVPCVIYGGAKEVNFYAPAADFKNIVYTPDFMLVQINIDGSSYKCVLKEMQFDKVSDLLLHVDFLELVEDKKVTVTIPLKFHGVPAGVKAGGKLATKMKSLKVKTYPKYLRENIDMDITNLELNENLRVQDVVAENMEILNSPRIPIASVGLTRQLKQEEATAPKEAAATAATPAPAAAATAAKPTPAAAKK